MPCKVGEEIGSHVVLELLPQLEFPQGNEMYTWFYNTVPARLHFSMKLIPGGKKVDDYTCFDEMW